MPVAEAISGTFFFRQFFKSVPDELVEAARIDGAGPVKFFIDILIPLSRASRSILIEGQNVEMPASLFEYGAYGMAILDELEARTGTEAAVASVYAALDRLQRRGLVRSAVGEPTPERGGRAKRFFALTPAGGLALHRSRTALDALWENVVGRKLYLTGGIGARHHGEAFGGVLVPVLRKSLDTDTLVGG